MSVHFTSGDAERIMQEIEQQEATYQAGAHEIVIGTHRLGPEPPTHSQTCYEGDPTQGQHH